MKARVFEGWELPNRRVSADLAGFSLLRDDRASARASITGMLAVRLSDAELEERDGSRMPEKADGGSGALRKGAEIVGSAEGGALTYPGRAGETHCYADI